ncbi:MAG: hypothetical protein KAS32_28915 [Candidatus Peribacteraceae bacterium]|nr:hypothetical protein [Candidatus Peribacteraceae bacterium]
MVLGIRIFEYLEANKGKKKLKEKDIVKHFTKELLNEGALEADAKYLSKTELRGLINAGALCYSYGGGASSVEIPSDEYLKEKGIDKTARQILDELYP